MRRPHRCRDLHNLTPRTHAPGEPLLKKALMKNGDDEPESATEPATEPRSDRPWYSPGLRFSCTGCGGCCTGPTGFVFFNRREGRQLARRLGVDEPTFYRLYARETEGGWSLNETLRDTQYDCVFLEPDGRGGRRCGVYEDRPTQCRTWPFWESNLRHPRDWEQAAEHCPGMERLGVNAGSTTSSACCGSSANADAGSRAFVPVDQIRIRLAENPEGL